jgi:hypothetical protein
MGRTLGVFFLFAALAVFGVAQQTTIVTPTSPTPAATPGQPMSGALPIPAPPQAALPGSGTPVGTAPDLDINNAATGGAGAVVQPGVGDVQVGGVPVLPEPRLVTPPEAAAQNTAQPYSSGAQLENAASEASANTQPQTPAPARFRVGGAPNAQRNEKSLAEIAEQYHAKKPLTKHSFDNSDLAALNNQAPNGLRSASDDLPQSDEPATAAPQQKDDGVLDQQDLKKVQEALERSKKNPKH